MSDPIQVGNSRYMVLKVAQGLRPEEGRQKAMAIQFKLNENNITGRENFQCSFEREIPGTNVRYFSPSLIIKLAPDVPEQIARSLVRNAIGL